MSLGTIKSQNQFLSSSGNFYSSKKKKKTGQKHLENKANNVERQGPISVNLSMDNRVKLAQFNTLLENTESSVSLVQTALGQLEKLDEILHSIRDLAQKTAKESESPEDKKDYSAKNYMGKSVSALNTESTQNKLNKALSHIDDIASATQFGGKKLLNGTHILTSVYLGNKKGFICKPNQENAPRDTSISVEILKEPKRAYLVGTEPLKNWLGKSEVFTLYKGEQTLVADLSKWAGIERFKQYLRPRLLELELDMALTATGGLLVFAKEHGSANKFYSLSSVDGLLGGDKGKKIACVNGSDVEGKIEGIIGEGNGYLLTAWSNRLFKEISVDCRPPLGKWPVLPLNIKLEVIRNNGKSDLFLKAMDSYALGRIDKPDKGLFGIKSLSDIDFTGANKTKASLQVLDKSIKETSIYKNELKTFFKEVLFKNLSHLRDEANTVLASDLPINSGSTSSVNRISNGSREVSIGPFDHTSKEALLNQAIEGVRDDEIGQKVPLNSNLSQFKNRLGQSIMQQTSEAFSNFNEHNSEKVYRLLK